MKKAKVMQDVISSRCLLMAEIENEMKSDFDRILSRHIEQCDAVKPELGPWSD